MSPPAEALREAPVYPRPPGPRRRSGPVRHPRRPAPRSVAPVVRARGARALDRLLRGRGWVMLIAFLLAGIVFLNVSVLELNRGIASTTARAAHLEAQNSLLRSRLADVASAAAIQRAAQALGFVLPQPGDIAYLRQQPGDAAAAARRFAGLGAQSSLLAGAGPVAASAGAAPAATGALGASSAPAASGPSTTAPSGPAPAIAAPAAAPTGTPGR